MRLASTTDVRGDVTLVECTVENDGTDRATLRIESLLDGPVWPPRRHGRPAPGWDAGPDRGDGDAPAVREATLAPGETVAIGFASPAAPVEPPVAVETVATGPAAGERGPTAGSVLADCGDPRPPRAALPAAGCAAGAPAGAGEAGGRCADAAGGTTRSERHGDADPTASKERSAVAEHPSPDQGAGRSAESSAGRSAPAAGSPAAESAGERATATGATGAGAAGETGAPPASATSSESAGDGRPSEPDGEGDAPALPDPVGRWLADRERTATGAATLTTADRRALATVVERAAAALDADAAGAAAGARGPDEPASARGVRRAEPAPDRR